MRVDPKKGGGAEIRLNATDKKELAKAYDLCERLAKYGRCKAAWKAFDALKVLLAEFDALPPVVEESEPVDEKSPTA